MFLKIILSGCELNFLPGDRMCNYYRIYYHLGFKDMKTKVQKEHPTCSRVTTGQTQADG